MKRLIRKAESNTMYHGTHYENARKIIKEGAIRPRSETGSPNEFVWTSTMQDDGVYLSRDIYTSMEYGGDYPVIFELVVDTENDNVRLDEDAVKKEKYLEDFINKCKEKGVDASKFENMDPWDFVDPEHTVSLKEDEIYGPIILEVIHNFKLSDAWENRNLVFVGSIPLNRISKMIVSEQELETTNITLEELEKLASEAEWEEL